MSGKRHYYLCEFRIDGRRLYVVWYSDDEDGFVLWGNGKIASSTDEQRMRAFCDENAVQQVSDWTEVYDFDSLATWCSRPAANMVDPSLFLNAWNMFDDVCRVRSAEYSLYGAASSRAQTIYEKVFYANNLPAMTPPGEHYEPEWSGWELEEMSRIFRLGLAELRAGIHVFD